MTDKPKSIEDGPTYGRLIDTPARIRIEPIDPARPLEIDFLFEPYEVPEDGGDLVDFPTPKPIP